MHPPEIAPEDFLRFFQLDGFSQDWEDLGLDIEKDLWALEILVMADPEAGDVVPDTGGLRKLRIKHPRKNSGKRGGIRVCYVHFPEHWTVLLVAAYEKNRKDDLTPDEKKEIKHYIGRAKAWLAKHNY